MSDLKASGGTWNICWSTLNGVKIGFHLTTQPHGSTRPIVMSDWKFDEAEKNTEELQANAHLLRSARELYEALKEAREYIRNAPASYDGVKTLIQVDAALSVASGEESAS